MNSYDDLQRFKEKTQTNHIEFKDMSEQAINSDTTNWAVIKQLLNEGAGSVLDSVQRVDRAAPQPVDPAAFEPPPASSAPVTSHLTVQSFVATTPAPSDRIGASLLGDISASLQPPVAAPVEPVKTAPAPAAESAPLRAMPAVQQTAVSGASLLEQLAAVTAAAPQPAPDVVQAPPAPSVADAPASVSYKQLFSTAAAPASASLPKDMLLQPLLEKIASCR
jgi:hypothetical protein